MADAFTNHRVKSYREAAERRERCLEIFAEDPTLTVPELCKKVGVVPYTYQRWRTNYKQFATQMDKIRIESKQVRGKARRELTSSDWDGKFQSFRKIFFKHDSPWFHVDIVKALEEGEPGSVTLILCPPRHGKTTLLEDFCNYKLAVDPDFSIVYASEKEKHATKALNRVKARMMDDKSEYVRRFGPFAPKKGHTKLQSWAQKEFTVFNKLSDEREYSMQALGFGAAVAGTRTDLLVIDDVQSLNNYNQTDDIIEAIQQDWLSRPGSEGRTVIIGTRVGDDDVYERLIDSGILSRLIQYRAYDASEDSWPAPSRKVPRTDENPDADPRKDPANIEAASQVKSWLWPDVYTPEKYLIQRINAGEEGWARNYMQQPRAKGSSTFTDDMVDACLNPLRKLFMDAPAGTQEIVATLDPGFGTNAWMVTALTATTIAPLSWRVDLNLTSTEQIFGILEDFCHQFPIGHVILEDKAFQKGLLEDASLQRLRKRFGFTIGSHQTGVNKYDPELGIPQMVRSFIREEFDLPGGDDPATKEAMATLRRQLIAWRPYKKGTRLTQDLVITLWFAWMRWMHRKEHLSHMQSGASAVKFPGLPYKPTSLPVGVGLVRR